MMHMTFYWGKDVTILFDSWKTATWMGYLLSLLSVFAIAAFYQYLEGVRIKLKLLKITKTPSIETPLLLRGGRGSLTVGNASVSLLFGINSAIGYMLMLAVMSFNGGVFVAAVLGLTLGYLAFRCAGEDDVVTLESSCACS